MRIRKQRPRKKENCCGLIIQSLHMQRFSAWHVSHPSRDLVVTFRQDPSCRFEGKKNANHLMWCHLKGNPPEIGSVYHSIFKAVDSEIIPREDIFICAV